MLRQSPSVTGLEFEFLTRSSFSRDQELRIKFKIPNIPSNSSFTRSKLQIKFKISNVATILVSNSNPIFKQTSRQPFEYDRRGRSNFLLLPPPSPPPPARNLVLTCEVQVTIKRSEVKRDNVSGINWAENARRVKMADNLFCLAVWRSDSASIKKFHRLTHEYAIIQTTTPSRISRPINHLHASRTGNSTFVSYLFRLDFKFER